MFRNMIIKNHGTSKTDLDLDFDSITNGSYSDIFRSKENFELVDSLFINTLMYSETIA